MWGGGRTAGAPSTNERTARVSARLLVCCRSHSHCGRLVGPFVCWKSMRSSTTRSLMPRLHAHLLLLIVTMSAASWPAPSSPSPPLLLSPAAPSFASLASLSRPESTLPTEPILEGDAGASESNWTADQASNGAQQAAGAATAGEWESMRQLLQGFLPFLVFGLLVCLGCVGCCCCYLMYRSHTRHQLQRFAGPPWYGSGHPSTFGHCSTEGPPMQYTGWCAPYAMSETMRTKGERECRL